MFGSLTSHYSLFPSYFNSLVSLLNLFHASSTHFFLLFPVSQICAISSLNVHLMKLHPIFSDLLMLFFSETLSANHCLPCLSVSCPRGPPTGSWQWRSEGCCETWLLYWLHSAMQQLVHWKRARCAIAKDVLWRSENMWESVNVSQGLSLLGSIHNPSWLMQ